MVRAAGAKGRDSPVGAVMSPAVAQPAVSLHIPRARDLGARQGEFVVFSEPMQKLSARYVLSRSEDGDEGSSGRRGVAAGEWPSCRPRPLAASGELSVAFQVTAQAVLLRSPSGRLRCQHGAQRQPPFARA